MPADSQRGAEIAGQCADVGPGGAVDLDVEIDHRQILRHEVASGDDLQPTDAHRPGRELDLLPRPDLRVRADAVDLDRRDRGGDLLDVTPQRGEGRLETGLVEVDDSATRGHLTLGVVGDGRDAQPDRAA